MSIKSARGVPTTPIGKGKFQKFCRRSRLNGVKAWKAVVEAHLRVKPSPFSRFEMSALVYILGFVE